ncbi:response regulator [Niveispirillum sp. KHB5.9]|uniref:response regulator n=1 Tax=Niveispirillum sp. KHB5.9 TaxID=3400269 RepID=UPI003A8685A2
MAIRVLVADDHPLMRAALCQSVTGNVPDLSTVEASCFSEVEDALKREPGIDTILLDLHMPGMNGLIGLALLRNEYPSIPIIVVSASEDAATIHRAMEYGAAGFVPKSAPITHIGEAIRAVLDGAVWLPRVGTGSGTVAPAPDADMAARVAGLTPQQLRVLAGIAEGKLNKQIAYEMGVVETTVKAHVTVILRRLGVVSRTQAAIVASKLALTPVEAQAEAS